MSFLKSSISIMRCDFIFRSYFSGVLRNLGFAVVVELGSDDVMFLCFLLAMSLYLPFTIWLSLFLAGVAIPDFG